MPRSSPGFPEFQNRQNRGCGLPESRRETISPTIPSLIFPTPGCEMVESLPKHLFERGCKDLRFGATNRYSMRDVRGQPVKQSLMGMGFEERFLVLINSHQGAIHRICRGYAAGQVDSQDLFQEIVYQLWRSFPKYRGNSSPITWLYRVALNTAITALRRRSRRPILVPLERTHEPAAPHAEADDSEVAALRRAMGRLDEIERALLMCYLDDLSYARIGEILGISESNVGVRLTRIKNKLRKLVLELE
jgi:RNA polymerase sigma-70 factor, ECF subfamily